MRCSSTCAGHVAERLEATVKTGDQQAIRAAVQGGRTAVDWLYLLLSHLAIVPAPADCPPIEIVSGRKIDRRAQEIMSTNHDKISRAGMTEG